jgi:hypothetical protein
MKKYFSAVLLIFTSLVTFAQTNLEYFPSDLNIQPFAANALEPKTGFMFRTSENELSLNVCSSLDVLKYTQDENTSYSFGADMFTYTLLRGEKNFHFPVDAVDYLFGLNFGFKKELDSGELGARFRLSHISAHFVDGHFDNGTGTWRDGRAPRVYSREFLELMPYYKISNFRFYAGITYIFHVDPVNLGKDSYQIGFDYYGKDLFNKLFTPFAGYDLKVVHLLKYSANHTIKAGIKFGNPLDKGLSLFCEYYNGKSLHGEYFDYNKEYFAIGINLDL